MNLFIMTQILRKIIYFFSFSHKTSRKCCWILHSTTLFLEFCTTQLHIWKFCSNCIILCVMHKEGFNFCTAHWSTLFEMSNVIFFEENAFIMNLWKLHKINLSMWTICKINVQRLVLGGMEAYQHFSSYIFIRHWWGNFYPHYLKKWQSKIAYVFILFTHNWAKTWKNSNF